jgi:hypothetical protein
MADTASVFEIKPQLFTSFTVTLLLFIQRTSPSLYPFPINLRDGRGREINVLIMGQWVMLGMELLK